MKNYLIKLGRQAKKALVTPVSSKKKDKVLKKLINSYKDGALVTRNDVFFSLCKSIIGQQISVAAANSVFSKFEKSCKGKITAKNVNKLSSQTLKKCGLSRQKVRGIKDLAKKIIKILKDIKIL